LLNAVHMHPVDWM